MFYIHIIINRYRYSYLAMALVRGTTLTVTAFWQAFEMKKACPFKNMERVAFFPGSFDPMTVGHLDIINRAIPLFDQIWVGVGTNSNKQPMFPSARRADWIREIFQYSSHYINILEYKGLTVDCARFIGAKFIIRGIRYVSDFESEKMIADVNRDMSGIDTVFFTCKPEHSFISSTLVREVLKNNGDISSYVPEVVLKGISL